jgi:hypothetical protein
LQQSKNTYWLGIGVLIYLAYLTNFNEMQGIVFETFPKASTKGGEGEILNIERVRVLYMREPNKRISRRDAKYFWPRQAD